MDRDVTQYVSLLKGFLGEEVSAEEFQARYIEMFKSESRELDPSLFMILDTLFGDVDSLVLNPELMAELESQTLASILTRPPCGERHPSPTKGFSVLLSSC
jgi:hypothetical protein